LFARAKHTAWTYSEIFIVGMFAATLPFIIGEIMPLFGRYLPMVASIVWIAGMVTVVLLKSGEEENKV
jgi:hypothetical protein